MTGQLQTPVKFGGLSVNVMSYARGSRYETIDMSISGFALLHQTAYGLSGHRPILTAVQTLADADKRCLQIRYIVLGRNNTV